MDIWDQVPLCAYWSDQIKTVYFVETAACPKRQAVFLRAAMSHAQTRQMTADGSLLTIGWQMDWMNTANAATVSSCKAAQRLVGMDYCKKGNRR